MLPNGRTVELILEHTANQKAHDLRTNPTIGKELAPPKRGFPYRIIADPIVGGGNLRFVITSKVSEVYQDRDETVFKTLNSTYRVRIPKVH